MLWSTPYSLFGGLADAPGGIADLNNRGQILGSLAPYGNNGALIFFLQDAKTGNMTSLPNSIAGWHLDQPLALDDQGRILFSADNETQAQYEMGASVRSHLILLTPDGLSANPLPTPEPSTFMVVLGGLTVIGIRSIRRRCK